MKPIKYLLVCLCLLTSVYLPAQPSVINTQTAADSLKIDYVFKLYGQTRRYAMSVYSTNEGSVRIDWTIFSYQKWLKGSYLISPRGLAHGNQLSFKQPQNGLCEQLNDNETFGMISVAAFDKLAQTGEFVYSNTTYRLKEKQRMPIGNKTLDVFYVIADIDETEMWIWDNRSLPLICRIENNPLEINFYFEKMF